MTKPYENALNEALNNPYSFERMGSRPTDIIKTYTFETSSGTPYEVEFKRQGLYPQVKDYLDSNSAFEVTFHIDAPGYRNLDKSETGDSFRVFATIAAIVEDFIKRFKPMAIKFTSEKADGNGRESLYKRLAQGLAKRYGGELNSAGSSKIASFYITFPKKHVTEDLQDFRSFRNELKPLNDMSTTLHRDKAFNLATILAAKYGYKPVGKGAKATVFKHPNKNEVLKFFLQDSAYARWVKFCLANQGNPFLPKLRGQIKTFQKPWYYIRMENLVPVYDDSAKKLLDGIGAMQMELDEYPLEDHMERAKPPASYLWPIANMFNRNEKILDLHDGNIMRRPDGQLVIVDPFYNFYKTKENQYTIDPEHE